MNLKKAVFIALSLLVIGLLDAIPCIAAPHAVSAHRFVHQWRQVELLNDGTFAFMGSDNNWYLYAHQDGTDFIASCLPDVYVLPKNGYWSRLASAPAQDTITATRNTIIQWTQDGAPADLQSQDFTCDQSDSQ